MLEFAMPANASGLWRITIIGNINTGGGADANGRLIAGQALPDDYHPELAIYIGAAGQAESSVAINPAFTLTEAIPVSGTGAFAIHDNLTAEKAPVSSLYVLFNGAPYGSPYAVAIYQVTADPLGPVINSKPGARRAYFS